MIKENSVSFGSCKPSSSKRFDELDNRQSGFYPESMYKQIL